MIKKYIKAEPFFKDFLPKIKNYNHKIRGKNGRGNPISFSQEEKKEIKSALTKLAKKYKVD